ncbi:EAL domain-containing protein [Paraglaciecola sp. MB-3u-78]|uniref:EAL domain-containing protein n=1 Tax=Paraglaciecola sp. MB-3u-78 TaxID=2058332 RepID=UPI000C33B0DB|nr:EAL domain-containing protein [Paraglaciecola sp. MB-3u-78]PKG99860.1 diguanylate phosphodiesterase [Paraglaciecola sp. MB-3u-78]
MKSLYSIGLMLCFLCAFWHSKNIASEQLVISKQNSHINLLGKIDWLVEDKSLQLSDIQHLQDWQTGYLPNQVNQDKSLWGKFNIVFDDPDEEQYFLTVGNPQLDYVDVFLLDEKDRILGSYLMGGNRDYSKRALKHRLFITPIGAEQQVVTVFIRINDDGPLVFPVDLDKQSSLVEREQLLLAIIGFISGGLALLACYFLITYIFMRSPVRFWFALSSAAFLLLFLNTKGVLGQITGITAYISNLSCALLGLLLLTSAKVTFAILERVPTVWRYALYSFGFITLGMTFTPDSGLQITFSALMAALSGTLIGLLAFFYHKPDKKTANLVGLLGLTFIAISGFGQVTLFLSGIPLTQKISLIFTVLIMLGIMIIALAIEAHERVLTYRHNMQQQLAIKDLQHFYDLFRNSAEGLYTSSLDGQLISVNPAMCSLFGYLDEAEMLREIHNAAQFYATPQDRAIMLGEIHKSGKVIGKEIKGIRKDGSEFWFVISGQIKREHEKQYLFGSISDVTDRKQSNISLEYLATHDSLTGVYNRREFERRLQSGLLKAQNQNSDLTLLYMDLDQFKVVNDTCGHKAGDLLIKQLSQKLDAVVLGKGILARLGGDEFGVLLEGDNAQMAYLLANKLLNAVQEFRFIWENRIFTLGISIGQVPWQPNINSPEQLLSMADAACYLAKERGRNQVHTYSAEDEHMQRYESEMSWVSHINHALENDSFELYYQHYQALSQRIEGHHYEILLRMRDQEGNIVPPSTFFPAAERYNLTAQIDRWVVENYFCWLADNPKHNAELTRVSINLSGHSLADKELKLFVLNAFEKYKIPYAKVCFEITESMAILKMDETLEFINTFHKLGCLFALDDFGSGFSSYSYLKNLPVDQVKIDGGFVKDILVDPVDMAMVNSIKDVAKAMGMETVAEFVESTEIMVELGKMGVDFAQGYGVAKPNALADFTRHR